MTRLPHIHSPRRDPEKEGAGSNISPHLQTSPLHLGCRRNFLTQTQTWKYQEGEAGGGWCHLFRHMFVLVLKESLIRGRPFGDLQETKGRLADGSFSGGFNARFDLFVCGFCLAVKQLLMWSLQCVANKEGSGRGIWIK